MIYLIWIILNGIMVIYFLYLLFGFIAIGKRIFKPRFKNVSIAFMLIGIIQILSAEETKDHNRITISEKYKQHNKVKTIVLDENLVFDINMSLTYSDVNNEYVPIESHSSMTGFISGYEWELKTVQAESISQNNYGKYEVLGILKWNFFGINIYSQSKSFEGIIEYSEL